MRSLSSGARSRDPLASPRQSDLSPQAGRGEPNIRADSTQSNHALAREKTKFACGIKLIWAVQPCLQKHFASGLTQINSMISPSCPTEGRLAIVTDAGRDAVDAAASGDARGWQGGSIRARELTNGTRTNGAFRGRQSRVVLAPVAGVKFAEASRPNRADKTLIRG